MKHAAHGGHECCLGCKLWPPHNDIVIVTMLTRSSWLAPVFVALHNTVSNVIRLNFSRFVSRARLLGARSSRSRLMSALHGTPSRYAPC